MMAGSIFMKRVIVVVQVKEAMDDVFPAGKYNARSLQACDLPLCRAVFYRYKGPFQKEKKRTCGLHSPALFCRHGKFRTKSADGCLPVNKSFAQEKGCVRVKVALATKTPQLISVCYDP